MNALPELRAPAPPSRATTPSAVDGRRDAFEQALARRGPPRVAGEQPERGVGAGARIREAAESDETPTPAADAATTMPGGAAIAGLQGIPDPLASLPAATRMALGATVPASPGPEGVPVVAALAGAPNPSALGALADHGIGDAAADDGAVAGAAGRTGAPAGTPRSVDESASSEGARSGPGAGSARTRVTGAAQGDAAQSGATDLGLVPGRATEPMPAPTAPAPLASGVPATMDAAALVARLIGQVPLSGSADDAIRMLFPAGSGPIEQIVLNREAGQLNLVVSATPSAREAVSRSVLDLERRLRDRGLPVGAVRLSERESGH